MITYPKYPIEYCVACGNGRFELATEVERLNKFGYIPIGGVAVLGNDQGLFYQAMVKLSGKETV